MENSKYCSACVNANTPMCNSCSFIEYAKEGESIPSQFAGDLADQHEANNEKTIADLGALITSRIERKLSIPLTWVIKYNALMTKR